MFSYFSLMMMLLSVHVDVKWGIASLCPAFMGGLSPARYRLVVPARHAENVQNFGAYQNIGAGLKFTDFCQTIAVSISAHRHPIKKRKKHKYSLSLSNVSFYTHDLQIRGCSRDPPLWPLTVEMGCGWWGGEGEGPSLYLLPPVWQAGEAGCRRLCAQDSTPPLSYKCLFLLLHHPLSRSKLDRGYKKCSHYLCRTNLKFFVNSVLGIPILDFGAFLPLDLGRKARSGTQICNTVRRWLIWYLLHKESLAQLWLFWYLLTA